MAETKSSAFPDDETSFDELQSSFQSVVAELAGDRSLDSFRFEYQKLYDAFKQSHDNNQKLIAKCRELNSEITANSLKVQTALKYSKEDQLTIATLRRDFEMTWRTVEALNERERSSKDKIAALKSELQHLMELVKSQSANEEQQGSKKPEDLINATKQMKSEIKSQQQQIETLKDQVAQARQKKKEITEYIEKLKNNEQEFGDGIKSAQDELLELDKVGAKVSQELVKIKHQNRDDQEKLQKKVGEVTERENQIHTISFNLKSYQPFIEDIEQSIRSNHNKTLEHQKTLHIKKKSTNKLAQLKEKLLSKIQQKEKEYDELKTQLNKATDENEKSIQLFKDYANQHNKLANEIDQTKHQITVNRQKIISISRDFWSKDSDIKADQRILNSNQQSLTQQQDQINKAVNEANFVKVRSDTIQHEVMAHKKDIKEMGSQITQLDSEIDSTNLCLQQAKSNINAFEIETQSNKDKQISLERQLQEIKNQKQTKEAAIKELVDHHHVDIRKYQTLVQHNEELQKDLHYLKLNVTAFKEALTKTDDQCLELQANIKLLEDQSEKLQLQNNELSQKLSEANAKIIEMENQKLNKLYILTQSKNAYNDVKKDIKRLNEEKKNIENEISKRAKEALILREKARICADQITISGSHYQNRAEEVENLKEQLISQSNKYSQMLFKRDQFERLKNEHNRLQKEYIIAQSQMKMLEDEAAHPISVHRWTLLEHTNPEQFQCIQLKMALNDKLMKLINRQQRLIMSKESLQKNYDNKTRLIKTLRNATHKNQMRQLENKYRKKDMQLNSLSEKTLKQKEETDEWREKVNFKENLILQQKEQFYITKLKDVPVAVPVHEPVIKFNKGQAPRSIVPRMKIIEPKPDPYNALRSARRAKNQKRVMPILPPLIPAKTAR